MDTDAQTDRTVVITGGTGGIGLHSAIGIAATGVRVIITGRNQTSGEEARKRIAAEASNERVELVIGDISSLAGVDALAHDLLAIAGGRIDALVNNAAYLGNELEINGDGVEMHFAVNVVAPWRLTRALLPALRAAGSARVLNVSAGDNAPGTPVPIDIDNLCAEKGFKGLMTMAHSKSVMESMSIALAQKLSSDGITVNVVFPGRASTAMTRSLSCAGLPGPMKCCMPCMACFFRDDGGKGAAKAARSTIWGCTSPELRGDVSGRYFGQDTKELPHHPRAQDPEVQAAILVAIEAAESKLNE
jgi:NAD(P)-dependent dehydrogenase (short-subunit alcohol dehydrogenase family)